MVHKASAKYRVWGSICCHSLCLGFLYTSAITLLWSFDWIVFQRRYMKENTVKRKLVGFVQVARWAKKLHLMACLDRPPQIQFTIVKFAKTKTIHLSAVWLAKTVKSHKVCMLHLSIFVFCMGSHHFIGRAMAEQIHFNLFIRLIWIKWVMAT